MMRYNRVNSVNTPPGGFGEAAPPVPISNTEVKRLSADDTALARVWENRSLPGGFICPPETGFAGNRPVDGLMTRNPGFIMLLWKPSWGEMPPFQGKGGVLQLLRSVAFDREERSTPIWPLLLKLLPQSSLKSSSTPPVAAISEPAVCTGS